MRTIKQMCLGALVVVRYALVAVLGVGGYLTLMAWHDVEHRAAPEVASMPVAPAQVVEEKRAEVRDAEQVFARLKAKNRELQKLLALKDAEIAQLKHQLEQAAQAVPVPAVVHQAMREATKTDGGLVYEAKRVLGDLGITRVRVIE